MVRTAGGAIKTSGKNSKMARATSSSRSRSPSNGPSDRGYGSYNSVCPRETPAWQKPITSFFQHAEKQTQSNENSSRSSNKENDNTDQTMEDSPSVQINNPIENNEQCVTNGDGDCEMEDNETLTSNKRREDDGHELAPKKRRKLNTN